MLGKSDKIGAYPTTTPYAPDDVGATVYHLLGVDPAAEVRDRGGLEHRPSTPAFLVSCSRRAFSERAERLVNADGRVREISRRAMLGEKKP